MNYNDFNLKLSTSNSDNHLEDEHNYDFASTNSTSNDNQTSKTSAVINPATAEIDVNYNGFSKQAQNAFEYAVNIWEGLLKTDVNIEIDAYWEDLSDFGSDVIGAAASNGLRSNFKGATKKNTDYTISLANHLAGDDLNGNAAEITTWFNSDFSDWYFGTDGNTPKDKYDFVTVVLHELTHGFGFADDISWNGDEYGDSIFESFIVNGENQSLASFSDDSKEFKTQLKSNDLYFNGANAIEANGGEKPKLYAPSKWKPGSSIAHLDEKTYTKGTPDSLMTPYFQAGEVIHNPGAMTLGILKDLGWNINEVETEPVVEVKPTPTPEPETPTNSANIINFAENNFTSYAGQDKNSIFTISDNKQQIKIENNGWKKFAYDYQVTEKTILEFDFQSDIRGEIQAIGFDTDDKLVGSDKKRIFQLEGKDKFGISNFKQDVTGKGWQTYQIQVGEFFTGNFNYLTFINDHDDGDRNAVSKYRNLRIYEEGQQVPTPETPATPEPETPATPESETPATPEPETPATPESETPATPEPETPTTSTNVINFAQSNFSSYAGQDKNSIFTISDNKQQIKIKNNGWKKFAYDYQVTEKTILEFDFQSDIRGEIQAIGFDTDDKLVGSDKKRIFQLEGKDKFGISNFKQDVTGKGWQTYQIQVGEFFTGNLNYLTFINDHDDGDKNAVSLYRNLRLYEEGQNVTPVEVEPPTNPPVEPPITPTVEPPTNPTPETPTTSANVINFEESNFSSYAGQDKNSIFTISDNKQEIKIENNGWKKFAYDYQVTEKTILEFDFQSDIRGEIQAIGFDTDDKLVGSDKKRIFQLEGKDKFGIGDFKEDVTGQGWKTYQIEVGEFFTGNFNYLTFINDHDNGDKNAVSKFRNLKIYEGNNTQFSKTVNQDNLDSDLLLTVNDSTNNFNISSYGGITQDKAKLSISEDKTEVELKGDGWKKLDIDNYNVTENTVLKFEFQTDTEAEIQGIGFDNDDIISGGDKNHLFQVFGTQDWGIELEDNYTLGSGWKTYEIKVGEYITGEFDYLTLANDHDQSNSISTSQFRNISLSEM